MIKFVLLVITAIFMLYGYSYSQPNSVRLASGVATGGLSDYAGQQPVPESDKKKKNCGKKNCPKNPDPQPSPKPEGTNE